MDTITIPQLDPLSCPDPRPAPELCLLAAVVQLALRDLQNPQYQAEAQDFIESEDLNLFCEWLDWNAEEIRSVAAEGMAPRNTMVCVDDAATILK